MLSELSGLQESEEDLWGATKVSFTIQTRKEESSELIQREYTFSRVKELDKWTFSEFEEEKTPDTKHITDRNWRRTRHILWNDSEAPSVTVPPEVSEQVEELLGLDELVMQTPGKIE